MRSKRRAPSFAASTRLVRPARVDTEEMPTSERENSHQSLTLESTGEDIAKPLTSLDTSLSGFFGPIDDENTIVGQVKRDKQDWTELDTVIRPVIDTSRPHTRRAAATRVSAAGAQSGEIGDLKAARESRAPPPEGRTPHHTACTCS